MPTRFHWLRLRATCHATEDPDKVAEALRVAAGVDIEVEATPMESHYGGDVTLLEATVTRAKEVRVATAPVLANAERLVSQLEARVDDDGVFYYRIDKQKAFPGEVVLTQGDDAIQCRLKVEVHPAGRERAIEALRAWLTD